MELEISKRCHCCCSLQMLKYIVQFSVTTCLAAKVVDISMQIYLAKIFPSKWQKN